MADSLEMVKGATFAFTVTLPANTIANDLTNWTPHASMREGVLESSPIILTALELVATIDDGPNRVILVKAGADVTAGVTKGGYVDVWIVDNANPTTERYRVKLKEVELVGRVTVIP